MPGDVVNDDLPPVDLPRIEAAVREIGDERGDGLVEGMRAFAHAAADGAGLAKPLSQPAMRSPARAAGSRSG